MATRPTPMLRDPADGAGPLVDLYAERGVIGGVILAPARLAEVRYLESQDFGGGPHRAVWGAILACAGTGVPDEYRVRSELTRVGALDDATDAALRCACDGALSAANVHVHAERIRDLAARRRMRVAAAALARLLDDERSSSDDIRAAREALVRADDRAGASVIGAAWHPLPSEWLTDAPPSHRWLLTYPDGGGMLPLGIVGILGAAGGVGKTLALLDLAVAVATGTRRWLGLYEVGEHARGGRVALLLGEEDPDEVRRRLHAVASAAGLDATERAAVSERVVVLPLAGLCAPLVTIAADRRTVIETPEIDALRTHLASGEPYALVAVDPLSRFAAALTETENSAATRTIQALETLTRAPGHPAVIVAHHTAKRTRGTDSEPDPRGVSGIVDAARWVALLTATAQTGTFRVAKASYGRWMDESIPLVRGEHGILRAATAIEFKEIETQRAAESDAEGAQREQRQADQEERRIREIQTRILAGVQASHTPITSRDQLYGVATGTRKLCVAAVTRLLADGRLEHAGRATGYRVRREELPL